MKQQEKGKDRFEVIELSEFHSGFKKLVDGSKYTRSVSVHRADLEKHFSKAKELWSLPHKREDKIVVYVESFGVDDSGGSGSSRLAYALMPKDLFEIHNKLQAAGKRGLRKSTSQQRFAGQQQRPFVAGLRFASQGKVEVPRRCTEGGLYID